MIGAITAAGRADPCLSIDRMAWADLYDCESVHGGADCPEHGGVGLTVI